MRLFGKSRKSEEIKVKINIPKKEKEPEIGDLTYRRILNAPMHNIERLLMDHGFKEYIGCSRIYIAEKMRERAKMRGRDYYL